MFGVGGGEMLVIVLVALIALGPEQLPGVLRRAGRTIAQIRTMADGFKKEFMDGAQEMNPNNWTGDGSDERPIVPRGYAQQNAEGKKPADAPSSSKGSRSEPASSNLPSSPEDSMSSESSSTPNQGAATPRPAPKPQHRDRDPSEPGSPHRRADGDDA